MSKRVRVPGSTTSFGVRRGYSVQTVGIPWEIRTYLPTILVCGFYLGPV